MPKFEKKAIIWIETHIAVIIFLFATILGGWIRFGLRTHTSLDYIGCLQPWYEEIKGNGGLSGGLDAQVGNYNLLYQFLIAVMTYLPVHSLSAYKMLSVGFDYLLAGISGMFIYHLLENDKDKRKGMAVLAYSAVLLSPLVFINSSMWAQCDSIYTFFIISTLYFLFRGKYKLGFVMYGLAFSFKLQAVFMFPFLLFFYFKERKFSLVHFLIPPAALCLSGVPGCLFGHRNILDVFTIYLQQTRSNSFKLYDNYPSFWALFTQTPTEDYSIMVQTAKLFMVAVLALIMGYLIVKKYEFDSGNYLYVAFMMTYTVVLFLPCMHERYGYIYEILAIILVFLIPETMPFAIALQIITLCTYGYFIYDTEFNMSILSVANVAVWVGYLMLFRKSLKKGEQRG